MFFGGPVSQEIEFVFDTGSEHLSVMSSNCDTCVGTKQYAYNQTNSTTALKKSDMPYDFYLNNDKLKGDTIEDSVCLEPINYSEEVKKTNEVELKAGDTFDFSNFDYNKEEKKEEKNEENTLEGLIK